MPGKLRSIVHSSIVVVLNVLSQILVPLAGL